MGQRYPWAVLGSFGAFLGHLVIPYSGLEAIWGSKDGGLHVGAAMLGGGYPGGWRWPSWMGRQPCWMKGRPCWGEAAMLDMSATISAPPPPAPSP